MTPSKGWRNRGAKGVKRVCGFCVYDCHTREVEVNTRLTGDTQRGAEREFRLSHLKPLGHKRQ